VRFHGHRQTLRALGSRAGRRGDARRGTATSAHVAGRRRSRWRSERPASVVVGDDQLRWCPYLVPRNETIADTMIDGLVGNRFVADDLTLVVIRRAVTCKQRPATSGFGEAGRVCGPQPGLAHSSGCFCQRRHFSYPSGVSPDPDGSTKPTRVCCCLLDARATCPIPRRVTCFGLDDANRRRPHDWMSSPERDGWLR